MTPSTRREEQHWTESDERAYAHRIAADFIAQIEKRMDSIPITQSQLARRLKVTEGAISKVLGNPQNLTLRTIVRYSRALGIKTGIVTYDDDDGRNVNGPIVPEVFVACWERAGKPRDIWDLEDIHSQQAATTRNIFIQGVRCGTLLAASNNASNSWREPIGVAASVGL